MQAVTPGGLEKNISLWSRSCKI